MIEINEAGYGQWYWSIRISCNDWDEDTLMLRLIIFLDQRFGEGGRPNDWGSTEPWWWFGVVLFCLLISVVGVSLVAHLVL